MPRADEALLLKIQSSQRALMSQLQSRPALPQTFMSGRVGKEVWR
jgi:hypothetical protein